YASSPFFVSNYYIRGRGIHAVRQSNCDKSSASKMEIASILEKFILSAKPSLIKAFMGASPMAANNARLPRYRNSTYHKWSQGLGVEMIRMSMYLYGYVIT
ncbi:TPA: hypothetical protein ACXGUB_004812, partial [Escherichia coli]